MMSVSSCPLISVIVPVYKVEPYLRRCLESICGQSYRNLEILCVDDGSPDNSIDILREFAQKDNRIRVIRKPNGGLSSARNAALDIAQGEWVTGVDSDDWLEPGIYEKAVACLSDDMDMLCFGTQMEWENTPTDKQREEKDSYFSLKETGLYQHSEKEPILLNVCFWNKLWRRSVIERYHLRFVEHCVYEDEGFFVMFMPSCKAYYILNDVGYHYLQRPDSIMGMTADNLSMREDMFRQTLKVADQLTKQARWRQAGYYFARMLKISWIYICYYCPEKAEHYRLQYSRLFFRHKLPITEGKRFKALMFSPFHPDVSRLLPNGKKSSKYFVMLHFGAYLLKSLIDIFQRDKEDSPTTIHEGI